VRERIAQGRVRRQTATEPMIPDEEGELRPLAPAQVTVRTVLTVLATALAVMGLLFLLWQLRTIVRWTVIATFLAVALNPAVNRLQALRIPRAFAILLVYLAMLLVLGGLIALIVPPLVEQGRQLVNFVISLYVRREGIIGGLQDLANQYGLSDYLDTIQGQLSALPARLATAVKPLVSVTVGIVSSIYATITILLLTFFLLLDGERFVVAILRLVAPAQRPRLRRILGQSAGAVSGYITGNLTISLIAGVSCFVMLEILRIPYPVVLALIVAFFDLIPLVGATVGAIIVSAVGLFVDPVKGIILIVFFLIYQQIENNILQPLVYGRSVKLHPLAVFLAVLAGGELLGILGALLAIPVAEVIRILLSEWLAARRRVPN
jgi:predicted PurR-regulated permease PerM